MRPVPLGLLRSHENPEQIITTIDRVEPDLGGGELAIDDVEQRVGRDSPGILHSDARPVDHIPVTIEVNTVRRPSTPSPFPKAEP
jgi:hypothetical protein